MNKNERAALKVLREAANVYNCWACLDDAIECDEDDGFTRELIEAERGMLADSIRDLQKAVMRLGKRYGLEVGASGVKARKWRAR